jgi:hypothetical protein
MVMTRRGETRAHAEAVERAHMSANPRTTGWMGRADEDGDGPRAVVSGQDVVFCFSFLFLFSFQMQFKFKLLF